MSGMSTRRIVVLAAVALVVLAAGAGVYVFRMRTVAAVVVDAAQGVVPTRVSGPGTVQARIAVTLASRITAGVVAVHADVGDTVKRGAVLVELDDRDLSARRAVVGRQREALGENVKAAEANGKLTTVRAKATSVGTDGAAASAARGRDTGFSACGVGAGTGAGGCSSRRTTG